MYDPTMLYCNSALFHIAVLVVLDLAVCHVGLLVVYASSLLQVIATIIVYILNIKYLIAVHSNHVYTMNSWKPF